MGLKDTIENAIDSFENAIDNTFGKPFRKVMEQVWHALIAAIVAGITTWGLLELGLPVEAAAAIGALVGLLLGLVREYFQNVGDEPDEDTLFSIGDLPVNKNMLWDITFYAIGAFLGSLAAAYQYLEQAAV